MSSNRLQASDYAIMLRIVGELAELPPDPLLRRRHAIRALADAFGARCGLFCHTGFVNGEYRLIDHVTVGLEDESQDLLRQYFAGQLPLDPCAGPIETVGPAGNVTHLRRELVPDDQWYHDEHVNGLRAQFGLDDGVYARVVNRRSQVFGVALIRERNARPLTPRHRDMLHVFNTHAQALFCLEDPLHASPLTRLAPRLRPVAVRFMEGDSVKQAARHLGLSQHTVVEYSKQIHRTFNVSSRAELLLVLMRRNSPAA